MKAKKLISIFMVSILMMLCGCTTREYSKNYDDAMALMEEKKYTEALSKFQEAVKTDGREAEAYRMEGIIYLEMNDYEHAEILLKKSLDSMNVKNEAFTIDVKFYMAQAYIGMGDQKKVLQVYTDLIENYKSAEAYFLRGKYYLDEEDDQKATSDFKKSLEADDSYENYINIYLVYNQKKRSADGAAYLSDAVNKAPDGAKEEYQQGRIYYYLEEYDKAKEVLLKAVREDNGNAVMLLGKIYLETDDATSARSLYQSYLHDNHDSARAYNGLALCDIAASDYDAALVNIQKGLDTKDKNEKQNLLFNEIVVYEKKLDFETAKSKMADFLVEYPDNEDAIKENVFLQSR